MMIQDNNNSCLNFTLFTGNIIKTGCNSVLNTRSNNEILSAINNTLKHNNQVNTETINPNDRNQLEITAKLFYLGSSAQETYAESAFDQLYKILGVKCIDTLITSNPNYWSTLEHLVELGKVNQLGVTELNCQELESLLNQVLIKPTKNQIYLGDNDLPVDLIQFSKRNNIELLHHVDTMNILTSDELTNVLKKYNYKDNTSILIPQWVLKYHVFSNTRNLITDKG